MASLRKAQTDSNRTMAILTLAMTFLVIAFVSALTTGKYPISLADLCAGGPEPDPCGGAPYAWHFGRQHYAGGGSGYDDQLGNCHFLGCADANVGGPEKVDRKRLD